MRNAIAAIFTFAYFVLTLLVPSTTHARSLEQVKAHVQVLDEAGNQIPYVTVWRSQDPCGQEFAGGKVLSGDECFSGSELKRTADRLIETFEYAASRNARMPFARIEMCSSADEKGQFREVIDTPSLSWTVNNVAIPKVTVWFVFMKQGYQPELSHAEFSLSNREFRSTVVMKAHSQFPRQASIYREAFERIRFELSDPRRTAEMTLANAKRLTDIGEDLERLARDSESAGENALAARIHWRLRYMPSILTKKSNGVTQIYGYSSEANDIENARWKQVLRLDPNSPFHDYNAAYAYVFNEVRPRVRNNQIPLSEADRKTIEEYVDKHEAEIRANMSRIWPDRMFLINYWFERIDQFERSYRWIRDYEQFEPKFERFENYYRFLQRSMKRANVPVPKEWNLKRLPEDQ